MNRGIRLKMQATSVFWNNAAYLIRGPAGCGKSRLALALLEHGAHLIADDLTQVVEENGALWACCPEKSGWLEVRPLGLISGFPVCEKAPIRAIINLEPECPERIRAKESEYLGKYPIPVFILWNQDTALVEKIKVIDGLLSGTLKKEL